jgi:hypothetical protein
VCLARWGFCLAVQVDCIHNRTIHLCVAVRVDASFGTHSSYIIAVIPRGALNRYIPTSLTTTAIAIPSDFLRIPILCVREKGYFNKKSKILNVHQRKNLR